jgi:hypothetical protein
MHHTQTKRLGWNHNGDFSGDVIVSVPKKAIDGPWPDGTFTVELPFEDIKELVAEYIRRELIRQIEDAEPDELIGGDL